MLKIIDNFLNSITMYRLVLYGLLTISGLAITWSSLGWLSFSPISLLISLLVIWIACYVSNALLSRLFRAPTNTESATITSLILFLILLPAKTAADIQILVLAGGLAMLSKYVLAIKKKHLFNPAAVALVILGLLGMGNAIWWVGSATLLPVVALVGLLIVRKIRRFHLFLSFCLTSVVLIVITRLGGYSSPLETLIQSFTSWPLLFFASVMLTEPLTTPPTKKLQMIYGALVGIFFSAQFQLGPLYATPELALLIGNVFVYFVSSKQKLSLRLIRRTKLADSIYDFSFEPDQTLAFHPGQYLEWTLPHHHTDSRGNRRYFTIASSPTEKTINLGVKIAEPHSSSFKSALMNMQPNAQMMASQLTGDFTLPTDQTQKLVFIAGGIGITPFRSMVKYLMDTNQRRDIILFYAAPQQSEFAYQELFDEASQKIGLQVIYVLTKAQEKPRGWTGEIGHLTEEIITSRVADYQHRQYYLSGPNSMVKAYQELLNRLSVPSSMIVTDYFPGF